MPSQTIQWFPGHMAKTRRMIRENLKLVDVVIEMLDARIPASSRNPEIIRLTEGKPTVTLLNKASLADPRANQSWISYLKKRGETTPLLIDCITGEGIGDIPDVVRTLISEKTIRWQERGMIGRNVKAMIVGIPNVGKSMFINRICGVKKTKVENRPGVTRDKQWAVSSVGINLLDMPGVLWPKFDDKITGENLAITGAIRDDILDVEEIASILCGRLRRMYPELLCARYKLTDIEKYDGQTDYELLTQIGKSRGFFISGGEIDTRRTANMLLDEFRKAKIGNISLETP